MTDPKAELARALALANETERKLAVTAALASAIADLGVKPVIVGGLAVEYWTYGAYSTTDIDVLLPSSPEISVRLGQLGFDRRGRHWVIEGEEMFLEAPGSFLKSREEAVDIDLGEGRTVSVLRPEDVLMYRLHEFVGTGHREAASQSVSLLQSEHLDPCDSSAAPPKRDSPDSIPGHPNRSRRHD